MSWIRKLFGLKEKEQPITEQTQEVQPEAQETQFEPIRAEDEEICDYCKRPIYGEQKPIHRFGKVFHHKPCWRQCQKEATKNGFNGK